MNEKEEEEEETAMVSIERIFSIPQLTFANVLARGEIKRHGRRPTLLLPSYLLSGNQKLANQLILFVGHCKRKFSIKDNSDGRESHQSVLVERFHGGKRWRKEI